MEVEAVAWTVGVEKEEGGWEGLGERKVAFLCLGAWVVGWAVLMAAVAKARVVEAMAMVAVAMATVVEAMAMAAVARGGVAKVEEVRGVAAKVEEVRERAARARARA